VVDGSQMSKSASAGRSSGSGVVAGSSIAGAGGNARSSSSSATSTQVNDPYGVPTVSITRAFHDRDQARYIAHMVDYLISNDIIKPAEVAIIYRRHAQSEALEGALFERKIPYQIVGGTGIADRKDVKDAIAYLRLLTNPNDREALRRVINYPPRGVGEATQERFFEAAKSEMSTGNSRRDGVLTGDDEITGGNAQTNIPIVDLLIALGAVTPTEAPKAKSKPKATAAAESTTESAGASEGSSLAEGKKRRSRSKKSDDSIVEETNAGDNSRSGESEFDPVQGGMAVIASSAGINQVEDLTRALTARQLKALQSASR
jgi:UvrD-like helicase C-terminal domain